MGSASTVRTADPHQPFANDGRAGEALAHLSGLGTRRAQEIGVRLWHTVTGEPSDSFEPAMVSGFPEPAQRWLTHAVLPGTPLARGALLRMRGEIRLGSRWCEYTARQVLVPDAGFVWAAHARLARLTVTGYDAFADGAGAMHWRVLGVPVNSASGTEVTRSAADRLATETSLLPPSVLGAVWHRGPDQNSAVYVRRVGGRYARSRVTVHVAADGRLARVSMRRWGKPGGRRYGEYPFQVRFEGERFVGGIAVPVAYRAAWQVRPGLWNEFFRAHLEWIEFG